jgi:hypothetical protein
VLFDRLKSADLARHPLPAGRELLDVACYLLLSDGDPVDGLPHRVENESRRTCQALPALRRFHVGGAFPQVFSMGTRRLDQLVHRISLDDE